MRQKILLGLMIACLTVAALSGCAFDKGKKTPYPENYYTPDPVEVQVEEEGAAEKESPPGPLSHTEDAAAVAKNSIHYFFDTSGSMRRSPEVVKVHAAATKCAAGFPERHFYGVDDGKLKEITEQLALSAKYGTGAPLDLIEKGSLPYRPDGVNIITTDMQSHTSATKLGQWLTSSGCSGFSFYIFQVKYAGNLDFVMYTTTTKLETVSITDCSFDQKEFLMLVFGDNALVENFDDFFKSKINPDLVYDMCHVSLDDAKNQDSLIQLRSSKCFEDDVTNVDFTNTNFCFGVDLKEDKDTDFTCSNTFVYVKSRKSYSKAKSAVKVKLYAAADTPIPRVEKTIIKEVLKYNPEKELYESSDACFQIETEAYPDGFPAVAFDYRSDAEAYERLNKALGGPIVPDGPADADTPVLVITVRSEHLPKGLYAVEGQILFEATGEAADLQRFAAKHTAGLEEYAAALLRECKPKTINGQPSASRFTYVGDATNSVFQKLLDFEKLMDEVTSAGAMAEPAANEKIIFRIIIDNR